MSRSRLTSRVAAGALATLIVSVGVTAAFVTPASAGTIGNVSPPFGLNTNAAQQITFFTESTFTNNASVRLDARSITPHPSACTSPPVVRCADDQTFEGAVFVVGKQENPNGVDPFTGRTDVSSNFTTPNNNGDGDATGPANPGSYDITITETRVSPVGTQTISDTCSQCFTILSPGNPTVSTTSVPSSRPGTTFQTFLINGTNFARGTAVEVLLGGSVDSTVRVFAQDLNNTGDDPMPDTATQLSKELEVTAGAPGGVRDLRVFNTDGGSVICARCLSIDSLLVDAVNPAAVDNRSGAKRIAVTGSRFQAGAKVSLVPFPAIEGQPEIVGTDTIFTVNGNGTQTISATVDVVGAAPGGNAYLVRVENTDGGSGTCACRFSIAGFAPTITAVTPPSQETGADDVPTFLTGTNLNNGGKITFSNPGVTVAPGSVVYTSQTRTDFKIDVASNAAVGKVNVIYTNTDNSTVTCTGCFEVTAAPPSPTPSASEPPPPAAPDKGLYTPIDPTRILDTRDGTGGVRSPLSAQETRPFQVTGQAGIPAGATAVAFNLTAISPSSSGFLTAFPAGSGRPVTSSINFVRGDVIANLVIVRIGSSGQVNLYNNSGTTNVAVDAVGYFAEATESTPEPSASASASGTAAPSASAAASATASPSVSASASPSAAASAAPSSGGGRYTALVPSRILDTRDGNGGEVRPIGPGESRQLQVTGRASVPTTATAVVVNLTAISPTASGFLTAFPTGTNRPTASTVNFVNGDVIPNLAIVRLGAGGRISIYNNSGNTQAAADVVGYFGPSSTTTSYTPVLPQRILDTRDGSNSVQRPLASGETRPFKVTGFGGVPNNATAVAFNLTAVQPTASGFFTAFPTNAGRPNASNLNFVRGEVIANLVIVRVGSDGNVNLFNSAGSTNAVADVVGYFAPFSAPPTQSPTASPSASGTSAPSATASTSATAAPSTSATATPSTSAVAAARRTTDEAGRGLLVGLGLFVLVGALSALGVSPRISARYARRH